jgi:hypothetical protein
MQLGPLWLMAGGLVLWSVKTQGGLMCHVFHTVIVNNVTKLQSSLYLVDHQSHIFHFQLSMVAAASHMSQMVAATPSDPVLLYILVAD